MYWYWWAWFVFVILLIFVPLGYGWGYRGWGPPYPRYYYRRRSLRSVAARPGYGQPEGSVGVREDVDAGPGPWGVVADLLWLAAFGAAVWAVVAFAY